MRNDTKSEIIIKMSHIDNADRLYKFLKETLRIASMGGDLEMTSDVLKERTFKVIGHDVRCEEIKHVIGENKD